jgi:hypothetical protein
LNPVAAAALLALLLPTPSQSAAPSLPLPEVSFTFERPGLPVPTFVLTVNAAGSGTYSGSETQAPSRPSLPAGPPQPFARPVALSTATANKIFSLARDLKFFNAPCASKAKNIADTGTKTLTYRDGTDACTCTYNFAENKSVVTLTTLFQSIATTMDEGRRLDHMHRYDRLGLDAEMIQFDRSLKDGYAAEVITIAPTLQSIATDPDLIQRVRTRATVLLNQIPQ